MSADYGPAIWLPSPGRFWQGRNGDRPRYIVLHGTAGGTSAQAIGNWLNTQTERDPTSVHYVIGVDGAVVQLVSEADSAWGNGVLSDGHDSWWTPNPNWYTVSIEHCKPNMDNSDQLSPAQQEASFALVRHLCERWGIPKRVFSPATPHDATVGITGHFSIDPVNRAFCPGPYPWSQLDAFLNNGGNMAGVPSGWHDSANGDTSQNGTLTAPNGHVVRMGFRTFILNNSWNPADVPLEEEQHRNPVEWHNPSLGAGQRQLFRLTALRWNNNTEGVKTENLGEELQAVEANLNAANTQIATLNATIADLQAQLAAAQANPAEHQTLLQIKALVAGVQ